MLIYVHFPLLAPITLGHLNKEPVSHHASDVRVFFIFFHDIALKPNINGVGDENNKHYNGNGSIDNSCDNDSGNKSNSQ